MTVLERVQTEAYNKGFAMGKYTNDVPLLPDFICILENSTELMKEFLTEYSRGFKAGMLDTLRD